MTVSHDMQSMQAYSRALRPGLHLEPLESSGQAVSDEETDAIIRQILTESAPPRRRGVLPRAGRDKLPDIAPQEELLRRPPTPRQARAETQGAEAPAPALDPVLYPAETRAPRDRARLIRRLAALAVLGGFVWMWPWAIPLTLFVMLWIAVIVCATVGSDWIGRSVLRAWLWLDGRDPARAERLRARADALALRLDRVLDRLPERWTAGLYLPDFSRAALVPGEAEERPDPFARIAAEARGL